MKNSLEYAVETYFLELLRTSAQLKGKNFRHFDEDQAADTNCVIVEAEQGKFVNSDNPPSGDGNPPVLRDAAGAAVDAYEATATVYYRAGAKATSRENDAVAGAIVETVFGASGGQTSIEEEFRFFTILNEMSGSRENSKSLRKREKKFSLLVRLKHD